MFASRVHYVVIRSAVLSTVGSLFALVYNINCDQTMLPYSSVVLMRALCACHNFFGFTPV